MNLTERLDKHLQNIREDNGEISDREVLELLDNPSPTLRKALKGNSEDIVKRAIDTIKKELSFDIDDEGFDPYLIKYCICKASGVDSGIDVNKMVRYITNTLEAYEHNYNRSITNYNYANIDNLSKRLRFDRYKADREAQKLIRVGIDPKSIYVMGEIEGEELFDYLNFIIGAEHFAKNCGATELANKLKPVVARAKDLEKHIVLAY